MCAHNGTPLHITPPTTQKEEDDLPALTPKEVVRRLRLLGQPATLFGEVRQEHTHNNTLVAGHNSKNRTCTD